MKKNEWGDIEKHDTLPKLLRENARAHGGEVAFREKQFGVWNNYTWSDYYRAASRLALAFADGGLGVGDVTAMLGGNGPYWIFGAQAALCNRALSLGIYSDTLAEEARQQIEFTAAKIIICEDEEQVDKLLSLGDAIPSVKKIVCHDPRGMRKYRDSRLVFLDDLIAQGSEIESRDSNRINAMIDSGRAEDVALLIATSGTTAAPKFAEIQHRAFLRHIVKYLRRDPKTADDEYVSVLPLPWVMETKYVLGKGLVARMKINFVESPETVMHDLREIGPTFLLLSPRAWEQIAGSVRAKMLDSTPFKRMMFDLGIALGRRAQMKKGGGISRIADLILFRALRDSLGFSRLSSAATGGSALGPDTYKFFAAMGIPLRQLYGQTELLGAYAMHKSGDIDFETTGVPFDGVEIKIEGADEGGVGKIITRHDCMMRGYHNNAEAISSAFRDGWMETGDAGYFKNNGHLVVIDRYSDLAATADGSRYSPQFLENKLKFSPYIAEAVVCGDSRNFLSAMVCLRFEVASKWAERRRLSFAGYGDLASKPEISELIADEIRRANESLPPPLRIRRFVLLYKELDADDGELTRTKKIRRRVIAERYRDIIDAIYRDETRIAVDAEITLQDGGKQRIKTVLAVARLED